MRSGRAPAHYGGSKRVAGKDAEDDELSKKGESDDDDYFHNDDHDDDEPASHGKGDESFGSEVPGCAKASPGTMVVDKSPWWPKNMQNKNENLSNNFGRPNKIQTQKKSFRSMLKRQWGADGCFHPLKSDAEFGVLTTVDDNMADKLPRRALYPSSLLPKVRRGGG